MAKLYCLNSLFLLLLLLVSITACNGFVSPHQPSCQQRTTSNTSSNKNGGRGCVLFADAAGAPQKSQQAEYGNSLEMPDSYVRCGRCQTVYALKEEDLGGGGRGRRLECSVCQHSWFQGKDRIMKLKDENFELVPLPQRDLDRIAENIRQGQSPKFMGEKKLYVGNVAFQCHEDDFFQVFSKCGEVGEVSLVRDDEGKNRGFGFVTMRTAEDGDRAIAELNGMSIRGRNIAVRESNN